MKKILAAFCAVLLMLALFGCEKDESQAIEPLGSYGVPQVSVADEPEREPQPSANQATELENLPDPEKDTSPEAVPENVEVPTTTLESVPPPKPEPEPEPAPPPDVAITEVNETVWATTAVNVRAGASVDCERLGGLWRGDSVPRTGVTDNSWSRVEFEGKTAFVFSEYLATADPDAVSEQPPAVTETPEAPPAETATPEAPPTDGTTQPAEETPSETPTTPETPAPEPTQEPSPEPPPVAETIDYIKAFSDSVNYDNINSILYSLTKEIGSRRVGSDGNANAREYIVSKLSSYGFSEDNETIYRQGYNSWGLYTENVIARVTTATPSPRYLLVSAHFDTVRGTEGAVDNASGTAALLETARVVKQSGIDFGFEIRFCFFSAEEDGYIGAKEYISRQSADQLSRTECILNIDMAGYDTSPRPIALVVSTKGDPSTSNWNPAQPNVVSGSIVKAYYHLGDINAERYYSPTNAGKHDLVPFWNAGIRGATISWREIDFNRSYGNDLGIAAPEWIHTANDSYDNLDVSSVYKTTRLIASSLAALWEELS